ncbi:hypothetical protein B9Z55_004381 [Caenorhabditis nigoni]|uniref:Uncharacterized protein n=1 Tax=Caenorhabditis nigoni TaxID=1611254 RepID=A0A2G5UW29_9PELO|nr:hypothetical protein B9Z55_004381 [Caenorhabditis nigoni]
MLRRLLKAPDFTPSNVLKSLLLFVCNPIWFGYTNFFEFYTTLHPFRLAHFTFYHTFHGAIFAFIAIALRLEHKDMLLQQYLFLVWVVKESAKDKLKKSKRKDQNLNYVILGFVGMVVSVWALFGCVLAIDFKFHGNVFGWLYIAAICAFIASYSMIFNAYKDLYLMLPAENRPFFGIKRYVVLFGLFHLSVAIGTFFVTKSWPLCCLLTFASFIFLVNAWSCFFTDSYILCEHRRCESDMKDQPTDGIICHVAVRRNSGEMEKLPIGVQFDDKLDTSILAYRVLESRRGSRKED